MKVNKKIITSIISCMIMTTNFASLLTSYTFEMEEETLAENKISDELTALISESSSESYPVVIWLEDVDNIDIETSVENEIGFNLASLEEKYFAPSNDLINELAKAAEENPTEYLDLLMESHLELTETARTEEKVKTEQYLEVKKEIVSNIHMDKANSVIEDTGILNDKVGFISQYAPMIVCNLTVDEINAISQNSFVQEITKYEKMEVIPCAVSSSNMLGAKNSLEIQKINDSLNLTGNGVKIGFYETDCVSSEYAEAEGIDVSRINTIEPSYVVGRHATYCAGVAAGNNGIAPDSTIYTASCEYDWRNIDWSNYNNTHLSNLEKLISSGVKVINISWGSGNYDDCYNNWAKYTDYLIANTGVTIVCSTGNSPDGYILNPASSYNCIAVNGYSYYNPVTNANEELLNNYSYKNGNGCLKPDVIAPSLNSGTSTAAPYITGMIALLYQYKPSLMSHPEAVKAILMASCHKKCSKLYVDNSNIKSLNETMTQGITDRQGAGIPNMYNMISIVSQHSYGYGLLNSSNNYKREVQILQPAYGASNMNVSMSYLQTNVKSGNTSNRDDYDIQLSNPMFSSTKSSSKNNSSTEMIYTQLTSNDNYKLTIKKYSGSMENVHYGYAWSTDNTTFYPSRYEEGIYYIKNVKSGKYLTMNSETLNASQSDFTGDSSQQWVLKVDNIALIYYLQSADGNEENLEIGNLINGEYYRAVGSPTSSTMYLFNNGDGTFSFERFKYTNGYRLGIYNNSLSQNSASWYKKDISNISQQWYLESIEYKRGDVDMDGEITLSDADYVMDIYSDLSVGNDVNNIKKYLADYNGNGMVNSSDASLIRDYLKK